ncbi:hypothetical protein BHE74_00043690 [Ensete ventricosum]|uniref:Uncharacterized protein n=1 Tax=Ensete ventricosum TaxID=4639 RepID=A0A444EH33_ENSVE|nr:hypothetical protein B296_00008735 [Ensete ventricosum]RWW09635.1 hypothetical protein GW17_00026876 [Ensete ventricosum]RWW50073.1 hypothetical protein BHE74_00043690 [Ensete ventricosum]RZS18139.1 hypothetical protein BHM03_00050366 [Ensete ventricosum]
MSSRKRKRVGSSGRQLPCPVGTLMEVLPSAASGGGFDDPAAADVLLRLELDDPDPLSIDLHLCSAALRRSRYFAALLSDRWQRPVRGPCPGPGGAISHRLTLKVVACPGRPRGPFDAHVAVLRLLHTLDFSGAIGSASDALEMIPVASELLFDDCIRACVRFLEAVPWTEEEEDWVLNLIPFLPREESQDLLARVLPAMVEKGDAKSVPEEMLHGLIDSATRSHPNVATIKAFVAKLLRDYPSRDSVRRVLDQAFLTSLETVKDHLGKYASPDFRVAGDNDEREAMQRLNLHAAVVNAKHLHWLVERTIELRVADTAVAEWSEQAALAADLQKTFRDDAWKNIAPGLLSLVMKSTFRLANAVVSGTTLAPRQVFPLIYP